MAKIDDDAEAFVEHRSRKMMSFAVYRKLKAVVDSWNREERGKAKVAAAALYGLLAWFALLIAAALFLRAYVLPVAVGGFLAWIGFVAVLLRRHLGTPPETP